MFQWVIHIALLGIVSAVIPDPVKFSTSHVDHVVPRNVTPQCLAHTSHWMSQLRQGELWAMKMLDSATKLPSGVLLGVNNHLGNFEQCLEVTVQEDANKFSGQFCRAWMDLEIPGQVLGTPGMIYAFCVPSSCLPEEVPQLLQEYIGPELGIGIGVWSLNPMDCYTRESPDPLPDGTLIFAIIAGVMVSAVVLSAIAEWRLKEKTPALVRACSLTSTCRSLFNTRKHPADISCLHGIRVGSMFWIILGHRFGQNRWMPISNPDYFDKEYFANPFLMTVGNAMLGVDTFFLLSGLLMCTSFLREVHRSQTFDVIKFYIYRYLRLALPIGIIIALYITVLPLIGNGPIWNSYFFNEARYCKENWYLNMIFVNNVMFKPGTSYCVGQTWYTGVDMQLAWLSPLVLLPLYHSPRAGLQLMTLLILITCFIPFTSTYIYHFPMTVLQIGIDIPMEGVPEGGNFSDMIYNAPQSRASPYLCGILFGYYLFKKQSQKINFSKIMVFLGWTINTLLALTVIYSLTIAYQPDYKYDVVGSSFYAGFHRLGWSAALIWIIFACVNGIGGVVDKILSWNMFLPLSRLTYSAFLVHFIIMIYDTAIRRTSARYTDFDSVHDFFGDLVPVYLMSFILYVLIEGPLLALLRVAFSKGKPPSKIEKKSLTNEDKIKISVEKNTPNGKL